MAIRERREREREDRQRLIIKAARELAETHGGWEVVTTRRLAEQIEYSQPVLYSHFKGKDEIMAAVALEGFAELGASMREARQVSPAAVALAYVAFAEARPVLYETMFTSPVELTFASPETPAPMREAYDELREAVRTAAGDGDLDDETEVLWAGLHGLVMLTRGGRLPPESRARRLELLLRRFGLSHEGAMT
ncbi:TetR/AcrR family transcriptional regulator [Paractinoplanes brasiliensis]|uniref:TetR family transcriptional regulator n=1 Tax=Paractinoplanes brasiliensis TaxID=52695 RepID=A0A4R6JDY5_9ACTN|nr:TetR/AcrR family transcriptional regulator [Actinoplanes brasiliensis]TDO32766.1 TetR family transcriptional regulator [Actinoplanes brasiliensis]GID31691.1 TetR family transcriptional regulator [Actinoplanes brasiliensis]